MMDKIKNGAPPHLGIFDDSIYKSLFPHLPILAYVLDKHCALIDCTRLFLTDLGIDAIVDHSPGGIYKIMSHSAYWIEKEIIQFKSKDIEVILSGRMVVEEPHFQSLDKHNNVRDFLISRIPLFDDRRNITGLLVTFKEVTELHTIQNQLDTLKSQLQQMNAVAAEGVNVASLEPLISQPLNVLVVDDNVIAQKAAQGILMQLDCLVDVANSESQMVDFFEPGKYDIIFMDIGMEETSGYMLAKQIRAQENGSQHRVPIIALTGYKAEMLTTDCGYYQMEGAITKPLTIEQARQLIQRYILNIDIDITGFKSAIPPNQGRV
jgi:CheY-like chemotaxis protein